MGNLGQSTLRGPSAFHFDMSLVKRFRITETKNFEFRVAAVNAAAISRSHERVPPATTPITVRGPVTYAGPGSLGGTASALPRAGSPLRR